MDQQAKYYQAILETAASKVVKARFHNTLALRGLPGLYRDYQDILTALTHFASEIEKWPQVEYLLPNLELYLKGLYGELNNRAKHSALLVSSAKENTNALIKALADLIPQAFTSTRAHIIATLLKNIELLLHDLTRDRLLSKIEDLKEVIQNTSQRIANGEYVEEDLLATLVEGEKNIIQMSTRWKKFIQSLKFLYQKDTQHFKDRTDILDNWVRCVEDSFKQVMALQLHSPWLLKAIEKQVDYLADHCNCLFHTEIPTLGEIEPVLRSSRVLIHSMDWIKTNLDALIVTNKYNDIHTKISIFFSENPFISVYTKALGEFSVIHEQALTSSSLSFRQARQLFTKYQVLREVMRGWEDRIELFVTSDTDVFLQYESCKLFCRPEGLMTQKVLNTLLTTFTDLAATAKSSPYLSTETVKDLCRVRDNIEHLMHYWEGMLKSQETSIDVEITDRYQAWQEHLKDMNDTLKQYTLKLSKDKAQLQRAYETKKPPKISYSAFFQPYQSPVKSRFSTRSGSLLRHVGIKSFRSAYRQTPY